MTTPSAVDADELEGLLITWTIFVEKVAALEPKISERAKAAGKDPSEVLAATWASVARIASGITCAAGASSFVDATDAAANADHEFAGRFLARYREVVGGTPK